MKVEKETITIIYVEDSKGGYTSFCPQRPEYVAEGDTQYEARLELMKILSVEPKPIDQ